MLQPRDRFLYGRINLNNDHFEVCTDSPSQQGPILGLGTELNAFGWHAKHGARDGDATRISFGSAIDSEVVMLRKQRDLRFLYDMFAQEMSSLTEQPHILGV